MEKNIFFMKTKTVKQCNGEKQIELYLR